MGRPIVAVVPVKRLVDAKGRLAGVLTPEERAALSLAMLDDVLLALLGSRQLGGVTVVTSDTQVRDVAGVRVLWDRSNAGLNPALTFAAGILAGEDFAGMLVVSADLPLLTSEAVDQLVACEAEMVLCSDRAGTGTNALRIQPPDAVSFRFGVRSRTRHQVEGRRRGLSIREVTIPEVAHDVDEASDLLTLALRGTPCHTQAWLDQSGVGARLRDKTAKPVWA